MNIYLKNELVEALIKAGVKDIPEYVFLAVKEKLARDVEKQ